MSRTVKVMVVALLVVVVALSFGAGYTLAGRNRPALDPGLELVAQAWGTIFNNYVGRDELDAAAMSQAAIGGMLEALDDSYSSYLDAEAYQLGVSSLEGRIEGIGAEVAIRDKQLVIVAPLAGSPAAKAGIKAGDIVLEVDGSPTSEMSLVEAVLKIRGPKGTSVTLLVLHQEEIEPEAIEIVRAEIELPSVLSEMRGDVAYINITRFTERTDAELSRALQSVGQEAAVGIILDLRSDPGGILEAAIDAASRFLKEGVAVKVMDSEGEITVHAVKPKSVFTDLPMVVLVDSYTASASEVLAGALQDYARATVAGAKTYGKGSVNKLYRLEDGSGLYLTVAHWLTPNGRLIEGEGLSPDYELALEGEATIEWAIDYLKGQ